MSTTPRLYVARRRRGEHTVFTAVGTIAKATVIELRSMLLQALARHERSLLLDLAGVDHIDDAGLDALRRTAARAHLIGGQLRLVAPSPAVAERLRTSELRRHVAVDTTLVGALDAAAGTPEPGLEAPPADWLEQHQPVDPTDDDTDGELDAAVPAASDGEHPLHVDRALEVDPADLVEQHVPVPFDEEDYPTGS